MLKSDQIRPGLITRPGLGVTFEPHDPALLERVVPLVDYLEVGPDTIARMQNGDPLLDADVIVELKRIAGTVQFIAHGVTLSLGSHEGYSQAYIDLLDKLLEQIPLAWHSEHLAYTTVDGEHLGTMLPLPKTKQALDMICERVVAIQDRYRLPFLVENVVHLLPDYPGDYSEAGFLNALTAQTGCGLLLDVYNLECDAQNHGFDISAFLDELDLARVREIHVACGVEHRGLLLDVHSRRTRESTLRLARTVVDRAGGAVDVVTFEFLSEALPSLGRDAIVDELERLKGACATSASSADPKSNRI